MTTRKLVQNSFVNGQYDRSVQNQESINGTGIVARGLSQCKNVLSSDKGELRKRLGTKYLRQLPSASVIIPFRMPDEDDAVLVADTANITGYKYVDNELEDLNSVTADAAIPFPANNTWSDGVAGSDHVDNGDWRIGISFAITGAGGTVPGKPGKIINNTANNGFYRAPFPGGSLGFWRNAPQSVAIENSNTPFCLRSIKFWFHTFNLDTYADYYWYNPIIEYSDDGNTWTGVQTDFTIGEYTGLGVIQNTRIYHSKRSMVVKQARYSEKHKFWRIYFQSGKTTGIAIDNVSLVDPGQQSHFVETSPYTEEQLKKIKYSQDRNEMFIVAEGASPYELVNNNGQLSLTAFTPMVSGQTIWSLNGGYPAAVSLFQNRVWFGGFENNPTKVIASKFDDYDNFTPSSPLAKDDRLDLRCNQLKTKIKNLVGGQTVMCCFSDDGISYIDGGSTGFLATNENIEFTLKNRMPASGSTPGFKDDIMLYGSSDGTKLYGVDFDLIVNRFQVSDLAIYAKDITKDKINEIHYVNNESKLVYVLTDAGKMFALLYEKGAYQGFFPLDFGEFVYDICPVKVGRNYKLLMVVLRDGVWYLEEKLDCGEFIDTSDPRMTKEDKKWATYDNLENNIALDCYQNYDLGIETVSIINEEGKIATDADLSNYIDKTVMFGRTDTKDWNIYTIDAVNTLTLWTLNQNGTGRKYYTLSDTPNADDPLFDENGNRADIPGRFRIGGRGENQGHRYIITSGYSEVLDMWVDINYWEQPGQERYLIDVTLEAQRGNETQFTMAYPEFTEFEANLPPVANVAIIGDGSYFEARHPDEDRKIYLSSPCHKVTYGVVYEASAMIKLQRPYESLKNVAQINLSVLNTAHLSVGTSLTDMQVLEDINDNTHYDLTNMTMNDSYVVVPGDTPEWSKFIIMKSDKGLPFTVNAVEVIINYSNEGGN